MSDIKFEIFSLDDGYGIVGYGAQCECGNREAFISHWHCEWRCDQCGKSYTFEDPEPSL